MAALLGPVPEPGVQGLQFGLKGDPVACGLDDRLVVPGHEGQRADVERLACCRNGAMKRGSSATYGASRGWQVGQDGWAVGMSCSVVHASRSCWVAPLRELAGGT